MSEHSLMKLPPPPNDVLKLAIAADFQPLTEKLLEVGDRILRHDVLLKDIIERLSRLTTRLEKHEKGTAETLGAHQAQIKTAVTSITSLENMTEANSGELRKHNARLHTIGDRIDAINEGTKQRDLILATNTFVRREIATAATALEHSTLDHITKQCERLEETLLDSVAKSMEEIEERSAVIFANKCNTDDVLRYIETARVMGLKLTDKLDMAVQNVAIHLEVSNGQHNEGRKKLQQEAMTAIEKTDAEVSGLYSSLCVTKKQIEGLKDEPERVRAEMWLQRPPFLLLREVGLVDCIDRISQNLSENNEDLFQNLELLRDEIRTKIDKTQIMEIINGLNDNDVPVRLNKIEGDVASFQYQFVNHRTLDDAMREKADNKSLETKVDRAYVASVFEFLSEQVHEIQGERKKELYDVANLRDTIKEILKNRASSTQRMDFLEKSVHEPSTALVIPPRTSPRKHRENSHQQEVPRSQKVDPVRGADTRDQILSIGPTGATATDANSKPKKPQSQQLRTRPKTKAVEDPSVESVPLPPIDPMVPMTQAQLAYLKAVHPSMYEKN